MLNPDSVGRTFEGAEEVTVTQTHIDAFCAVLSENDTTVAPPTFSIRITLDQSQEILANPEIGLDWTRVVHGDQRFEIKKPIVAGDIFKCTSTIESYKVSDENEFVVIRSDLNSDDQLAVSTWSTLVVRA